MTLAELLEQWAAAEPDRCRREPHSLAGTMRIQRGITGQMKIVPRAREHQPRRS
jgi:hypothetical protein